MNDEAIKKKKNFKIVIVLSLIVAILLSILIIINVDAYNRTYALEKYDHVPVFTDKICLKINDFSSNFYDFIEEYSEVGGYVRYYNYASVSEAVEAIMNVSAADILAQWGARAYLSAWDEFCDKSIVPALTAVRDFIGTPGREIARADLASIEYDAKPYWREAALCFLFVEDKIVFHKDELKAQFGTDEDFKTAYIDSLRAAVSEDLPPEEFYDKLFHYLNVDDTQF